MVEHQFDDNADCGYGFVMMQTDEDLVLQQESMKRKTQPQHEPLEEEKKSESDSLPSQHKQEQSQSQQHHKISHDFKKDIEQDRASQKVSMDAFVQRQSNETAPDLDRLKIPQSNEELLAQDEMTQKTDAVAVMNGQNRISTVKSLLQKGLTFRSTRPINKEGEVYKYSPSLFAGWQKRYLSVKDHNLRYYKTKHGQQVQQGVLNFDLYNADVKLSGAENDKQIEITIANCDRSFLIKGLDEKETQKWFAVIQKHIQTSEGHKLKLEAPLTKEFWRHEQITENQFIETADTFDLLLFRCNTTGGKLIRTYTGSTYDHAAMVLKFEEHPNEIFFLEATSNMGVSLRRWSGIRHALGNFYKRVVLRRLEFDRPDESLDNLEVFMKEVIGNSYSFSMKQLFNRQSVVPATKANSFQQPRNAAHSQKQGKGTQLMPDESDVSESNVQRFVEEGRAFFCSELVAKAWKVCKIMKQTDQASSNYLPCHFTTAKQTIQVEDGVDFQPEQLIFSNGEDNLSTS